MGCGGSVASERALRDSAVAEAQGLRDRLEELQAQLEDAQRGAAALSSAAGVKEAAVDEAAGGSPASPTCVEPLVPGEGGEGGSALALPDATLPGGVQPDPGIAVVSSADVVVESSAQDAADSAARDAAGRGAEELADSAESVVAQASSGEEELIRCGECSPDEEANDEVRTEVGEELPATGEAQSETKALSEPKLVRTQSERAMAALLAAEEKAADEIADEEEYSKGAKKCSGGTQGAELANSRDSSDASTCVPAAGSVDTLQDDCSACHQCGAEDVPLFVDPSDLNRYCDQCWTEYYGLSPAHMANQSLVRVQVTETWSDDRLASSWLGQTLPGWPPPMMVSTPLAHEVSETWSSVNLRLRTCVVGQHSREQMTAEMPYSGVVMNERYSVVRSVGEGHFTKAYLAEDLSKGGMVCVKRHRSLSIEQLGDMLVLGKRLEEVDPSGAVFPRLFDAFYDVVGFTVESLVDGLNCLSVSYQDPGKFQDIKNVAVVARDSLSALSLLDCAGIVHNDVKPDNIMWDDTGPSCRLVDFGCARLDNGISPGRNWALAEGGAGHLGKWAPEMVLRLPITSAHDVWGVGISLCELHCSRCVWRNESDTAEVVMAQALGLCGFKEGVPRTMLQRSPLDIRRLYTPPPRHLPVRRAAGGRLEALLPTNWGLEQVLGGGWREGPKASFGELLTRALAFDPLDRPSAADLVETCAFAGAVTDRAVASESGPETLE